MGFTELVIGPATSGRTRWLYPSYALPQRALTRTAATAILGCRVAGCMNSHSK